MRQPLRLLRHRRSRLRRARLGQDRARSCASIATRAPISSTSTAASRRLHPQLVDAIRLARDLGYRSINLTTQRAHCCAIAAFAERLLDSGITHLLISLHGATAEVHDAATDAPGSFEQTVAGIDNVMALRPAHVDTGMNVTIVRANVDHLMPLTALAIAKGFSKINFQFTTPFGRAYEDVVPPLEEAARAVMQVIDRYAEQIQIHVINAQFCAFPGYEQYVAGDLQKLGRTMVFAADPRFPEQVNLYEWLGARREKREVCATCPWTTVCEGFQVFVAGEARHARRARPPGGRGGVSDGPRSSSASSGSTTPTS